MSSITRKYRAQSGRLLEAGDRAFASRELGQIVRSAPDSGEGRAASPLSSSAADSVSRAQK